MADYGAFEGALMLSNQISTNRFIDALQDRRNRNQMYALNLQWQQAYDQVVAQREEIRAQREHAVRAHNSLLDRHEALQAQHRQLVQNNNALEQQREQLAAEAAELAKRWKTAITGSARNLEEANGWETACLEERAERKRLTAETEALRNEIKALKPPSGS